MVLYRNHTVPDRQGSAALEIQKIIESPLPYTDHSETNYCHANLESEKYPKDKIRQMAWFRDKTKNWENLGNFG